MKVEFTKYGELTVTPENQTENYALEKWSQDFFTEEPKEASLCINLLVRDYGEKVDNKN